jgi:hypothetical protein
VTEGSLAITAKVDHEFSISGGSSEEFSAKKMLVAGHTAGYWSETLGDVR